MVRGKSGLFTLRDEGLTASEEIKEPFELARQPAMVLTAQQKAALKVRQYHKLERKCEGASYANGAHMPCVDGGGFKSMGNFEHEHIVPRSNRGKDTEANLQCVCHLCNRHKSNHLMPPSK